jgi:hypothetical protein
MYLGYATQRNTISVLVIVNKQFEKTGQNVNIGKKNTGILVKSHVGWALQFMFAYELKPV